MPWSHLAAFTASCLAAALYGLAAAGHFPREHRKPDLADATGSAVLWITLTLAALAAAGAVVFAVRHLPWPPAVIAGCMALLFAPLVLQSFPDRFVDGRQGLLVLSFASLLPQLAAWATVG
jgi:hypothetical protein